ncbi:MAG: T9SS type A sorting domain-containing protein [Flavobacterium sp.]|nr:T9SS type A sorting domain-containing protein [Flavobacterium sp.]
MKNLIFSLLFLGAFHGNAQVTLVKALTNDEVPKSDKIEYNQIFNGRVYYFNSTSTQNCRLYASDGTSAGTVLIKDLGAIYSTGNGNHSTVGSYNQTTNLFYFLRSQFLNPATGGCLQELTTELWVTDGTTAGTIKLLTKTTPYISYSVVIPIQLFGDAWGTNPYNFNFVGNKLIFTAYDPDAANVTNNNQIAWVTDGTVAGTQPLLTANGEKIFGGALGGTKLNGKYFFGGRSQVTLSNGGYLYETDGTQTGTIKINPTAVNWYVGSIFSKPLNGKFLFWATNNLGPTFDQQNYEIWQSDGTAAGTTLFMETAAGFDSKKPYYGNVLDFVNDGEKLYFNLKQDPANNQSTEIWVTDGTLSNTKKIRDASNYLVDEVHIANGHVFFEEFLQSPSQFRMVYSDGTDSGTYVVSNINNNHPSMVVYNNSLYFKEANGTAIWFGNTVADNIEMWRSDGTIANTGFFLDIFPGTISSSGYTISNSSKPTNFFTLGDSLYFVAQNPNNQFKLYKFFGDYTFTGTINSNWNNPNNWLAGALPGIQDNATIPSGFNINVDANAFANNLNVSSPLNLTTGNLNFRGNLNLNAPVTLNANNVNLKGKNAAILNGNAINYLATNGAGTVNVENLNPTRGQVNLPIGTATNYSPIAIENTGTSDTFSVNVQDGISNTTGGAVNATWNISEAVTGGSNVNVSFTWNQTQENGLFNRNTAGVGHYYNTTWNGEASSAVTGTNPYTISATNISSFSPFGVLNQSALGIEDNNFVTDQIKVYPNPTTTQFYINAAERIESVEIYDVNGRKLKSVLPKTMATEIEVTDLKTGVYFVNISTLINKNQTFKLIKN